MSETYPVFLRFQGRLAVLVGGGRVAAAKLSGLLAAGARVRVVAPGVAPEIERPEIEIRRRAFVPEDLDGAFFVVAAAPPEVNRNVRLAADARGLFVNAVDDAKSASAFLGGVVRKGGVTVAVATDGRAPALAGLLREALERVLPDDISAWVDLGERVRAGWRETGIPMGDRRPLLLRALLDLYPQVGPATQPQPREVQP
ncbi:MAG: bifunctional precorrin-2 dehydrogenase/sirohydrochlorin ferrochelatase [Deltaproteobacteria bacterium]|nr:MAG: bifunctional precorrin-2 dehydrogenase/sirohydrochlorin ferrochelatase [Deltaproteobacteria bacterium]TMB35849.1 MAG: bifunctional precorrin-2 dehydrogenase/sirohydrochlorin ferrochelatase [Deltaproteobacteria bacterium]